MTRRIFGGIALLGCALVLSACGFQLRGASEYAFHRLYISGGGCSGFSYKFDLVGQRNDDDVAIEKDGATVLIDDLSIVYMGGSVIDFVDDLMGQSFQIRNPNAVASCGCGTSFSV